MTDRWTIYIAHEGHGGRAVYPGSPEEGDDEGIEVMRVSEHEEKLREAIDALAKRKDR